MEKTQEKIIEYFSILKQHGRIGPSYLFVGDSSGLITSIVKLIQCRNEPSPCEACDDCRKINLKNHPDVFVVEPPQAKIKIDQIREARTFLRRRSFQGKYKTLIIAGADTMTHQAANAFLKTLEEPPAHSFIVLLSPRADLLLPTITSRCQTIYASSDAAVNVKNELLLELLEGKGVFVRNRRQLSGVLFSLICFFRDYILFQLKGENIPLINKDNYEIIPRFHYSIQKAQAILDKLFSLYQSIENVNVNLAVNVLQISLQ